MIWKEGGADDDQGLGAFFQFGWAPSNRNLITEYFGGGLVYKGLLPGRDADFVGVGFANAILTPGLQQIAIANGEFQGRQETAIEVFYKYRFSPYFTLQPMCSSFRNQAVCMMTRWCRDCDSNWCCRFRLAVGSTHFAQVLQQG